MKILLNRIIKGDRFTIGSLSIDGVWKCWAGEDPVRPPGIKVYGDTAIPAGTYNVIVNLSPRLKKRYPRLVGVPNFDGILIHCGNDSGDTSGCILVGQKVDSPERISQCGQVFAHIFKLIDDAYLTGEPVTIEIVNSWDEVPFGSLDEWA